VRRVMLAFLVSFVCNAETPPGSVTGRVFDSSHAVIPAAKVTVGDSTTITNIDGSYSLGNLAPGDYKLTVSATGFAEYSATVHLPARDIQRDVTLAVAPFAEQLLVTDKAPRAENPVESWSDNVHASVDAREVRESGARDAGEALASLDGLAKIRKGGIANDILMRGLGHDNINVLVDGARIHGACPSSFQPGKVFNLLPQRRSGCDDWAAQRESEIVG